MATRWFKIMLVVGVVAIFGAVACAPQGTAQTLSQPAMAADAAPAVQTAGDPMTAHFARLEALNPSFESSGWQAWLSAAGLTWQSISADARQIEQEVSPQSRISAAALQIKGQNIWIGWPNILTTDRPNEVRTSADTVTYQPDARNPSVMYTNIWLNGQGTVWVDGQNWGQFTSKLGFAQTAQTSNAPAAAEVVQSAVQPEAAAPAVTNDTCMSIPELNSKYGVVTDAQGSVDGRLYDGDVQAGAVLRLNASQIAELESKGWVIQGSNPDVKSAWAPQECRPVAE